MMTTDQIKSLSPEEAKATFENLAAEVYGTDRWKSDFCRDIDRSLPVVHNWLKDDARPPTWAILYLDARAHAMDARKALEMIIGGMNLAMETIGTE